MMYVKCLGQGQHIVSAQAIKMSYHEIHSYLKTYCEENETVTESSTYFIFTLPGKNNRAS